MAYLPKAARVKIRQWKRTTVMRKRALFQRASSPQWAEKPAPNAVSQRFSLSGEVFMECSRAARTLGLLMLPYWRRISRVAHS